MIIQYRCATTDVTGDDWYGQMWEAWHKDKREEMKRIFYSCMTGVNVSVDGEEMCVGKWRC